MGHIGLGQPYFIAHFGPEKQPRRHMTDGHMARRDLFNPAEAASHLGLHRQTKNSLTVIESSYNLTTIEPRQPARPDAH
jgi:hypothetical protein